jgi:four helix bundle protein
VTKADELKLRTKTFAINSILFCRTLPRSLETFRLSGQLIDAATSVAANYRASCRARSHNEFIAKLGIVLEEADESELWLSILIALEYCAESAEPLRKEANELTAIFVASSNTARSRR